MRSVPRVVDVIRRLGSSIRRPNRLQAGFVGLVGASGGLMALSVGASTNEILGVTLASLLVGVVLVAYLSWIVPRPEVPERRGPP